MGAIGVILSGGTGERMGSGKPKQLLRLSGEPILAHTLRAFQESPSIASIILVMQKDWLEAAKEIVRNNQFDKVSIILPGGDSRALSTKKAIEFLSSKNSRAKILIHDAVRPFVSEAILADCVRALESYDAVDTAYESADTIVEVSPDDLISGMPERSSLRRGQTPQGFRLGTLKKAYRMAEADGSLDRFTDDCGVVFAYLPDTPIKVVSGSSANLKITEPLDLEIADRLLQRTSMASQFSGTPDLSGKHIVIFGSSEGIGKSIADLAEAHGAKISGFSRSLTQTDISNVNDIKRALDSISKPVDAVVVTAGELIKGRFADLSAEAIKSQIATNLQAPILIAKLFFPLLCKSSGSLILFSSSSYTRGRADYSTYSATKAAIANFVQGLSEEWSEFGVRVNCIAPGRTSTSMRTKAFGIENPSTLLRPEKVATVTLAALSQKFTGQIIDVRD